MPMILIATPDEPERLESSICPSCQEPIAPSEGYSWWQAGRINQYTHWGDCTQAAYKTLKEEEVYQ